MAGASLWADFWRELDKAELRTVDVVETQVPEDEDSHDDDDNANADNVDDIVDADGDVPVETSNQLLTLLAPHPDNTTQVYVRQAYKDLYDNYIKTTTHTLVTGNPGTGKSVFAIYVLYRLRSGSGDVIFQHDISKSLLHFCSDGCVQSIDRSSTCLDLVSDIKKRGKEVYYLCDCGTQESALNTTVALNCTQSIVFTLPSKRNYADYEKYCLSRKGGVAVYMPIWSWGEICTCFQATSSSASDRAGMLQRYKWFGGIARYVLDGDANSDQHLLRRIEAYIAGLKDVDTTLTMVRINNASDYSSQCVHMKPCLPDYTKVEYTFASPYVAEKIFHHFKQQKGNSLFHMMQKMAREPFYRGAFGQVFEQFAHYKICKGGKFKVRSLERDTKSSGDLQIDEKEIILFTEFPGFVGDKDKYYLPRSKTCPAIDSFQGTNSSLSTVFQMTTAHADHAIKMPALKAMMKKYNLESIKFYFVVPKKDFTEFKKQRYLAKDGKTWNQESDKAKIEQFVLSVDLGNGSE